MNESGVRSRPLPGPRLGGPIAAMPVAVAAPHQVTIT